MDIKSDIRNQIIEKFGVSQNISQFFSNILNCEFLLDNSTVKRKEMLYSIVAKYYYSECAELFKRLNEQNVLYAVLKGSVLSSQIYSKLAIKYPKDIDILINKNDISIINEILNDLGFVQGWINDNNIIQYTREENLFFSLFTHQQPSWIKRINNEVTPYVCVDINTNVLWGEMNRLFPLNMFLDFESIESTQIFNVELKKLKCESEFIALCLHHYKDLNSIYILSKRGFCFSHFIDIYVYLKTKRPNSDVLMAIIKKLKIEQFIFYLLYWIKYLFPNDKLVSQYFELLYDPQYEHSVNSFGLGSSERREWTFSFEERVCDPEFVRSFVQRLTDADKEKIYINQKYIHYDH